ncbi:MAG: adenylyl-sulfate reductase subunit alpha [Sarcina sp.]
MLEVKKIEMDILVIGGGASGLYGSIVQSEKNKELDILVVDKGNMKRSGCLAAGVNALNLYLDNENQLDDYIDNINTEFEGIVREDLAKGIGQRLQKVTKKVEAMGLTILKDKDGRYVKRGKRSIKINGENIKEILYKEAQKKENIKLLNGVNIIEFLKKDGEIIGAVGCGIKTEEIYFIYAKAIFCGTGGASGIYKSNSKGYGRHKMWYSPFNTGGGLAMGIRCGAEMTSFEMRFVALRIKNTIAPTGTIAQGIKGRMINSIGEDYSSKYKGAPTLKRLYGAIEERREGRGPCYIETKGIDKEVENELYKAYLNMAPIQTLYWKDNNIDIKKENVEIDGTEPYIVGGHSVSGYYVDTQRRTTIKGLYAGGDVVGGVGKKYVTGAFAEGEIAFETMDRDIKNRKIKILLRENEKNILKNIEKYYKNSFKYKIEDLEEEMQMTMDKCCGGISKFYGYTEEELYKGEKKIDKLLEKSKELKCENPHEFLFIRELIDRLYVSKILIEHMKARKETRMKVYCDNLSYPKKDAKYLKYCNSTFDGEKVKIKFKDLIKRGDSLEYTYQ